MKLRSPDLVRAQINIVHERFNLLAHEVTAAECLTRALRGTNLIGFTLWHSIRAIDSMVNMGILGIPEVSERHPWSGLPGLKTRGVGVGFSMEEADEQASLIRLDELIAYGEAVRHDVAATLRSFDDGALAAVPEFVRHREAHPAYSNPAYRSATAGLEGLPAWALLTVPCVIHVSAHLGEVRTLLQQLRTPTTGD